MWPTWHSAPFNGLGTPAFTFYAPLVYYFTSFFQAIGLHVFSALKCTTVFFLGLGTIGFKRLLKNFCSSELTQALGAFFFAILPFQLLHFYIVFFFQYYCATMFLPWLLACFFSEAEINVKRASLILGLIAWTHLPAAMLSFYIVLIAQLPNLSTFKNLRRVGDVFLIAMMAGLFAAPYAIPAMLGRENIHFEFLENLLPWNRFDFLNDPDLFLDAPFETLKRFFRFSMIAFLPVNFVLISALFSKKINLKKQDYYGLLLPMLFLLVLTIRESMFFWNVFPGLKVLQYPWRVCLPMAIISLPHFFALFEKTTIEGFLKKLISATLVWIFFVSLIFQWYNWSRKQNLISDFELEKSSYEGYPHEYLPKACNAENLPFKSSKKCELTLIKSNKKVFPLKFDSERSVFNFSVSESQLAVFSQHWDSNLIVQVNDEVLVSFPEGECGQTGFFVKPGAQNITICRTQPFGRNLGWLLMGVYLLWFFRKRVSKT
ncbi:MAG: hypothetical protein HQM08_28325 [Candidatus Riflebacteria bacterium]|nr:hypothetical protein [Candidatus Riflebacteria bacterium]